MEPQPSQAARRWPARLVGVLWPLALAGAVALAVAESRTDSPDARADRGAAIVKLPASPPRLVQPAAPAGPRRVRVPDVTGFGARLADRALARRHLEVLHAGRESLLPEGTVLDQRPGAGERARRGARVRLGLAVAATGRMPHAIGHDVVRATSDLWAVGLNVRFAYRRVEAPVREGTVLEQSPPTGYGVRPGQRVWLLVARR
jgi:eukaryotic-like serine/threonine-protein kinase